MTLFEKAVVYATEKHSGQVRKLTYTPYILHPMEVAAIVGTMTGDEEVLCAAMLHDTVEDAGATLEEIGALFGERVRYLVGTETEDKREGLPKNETWLIRKEESLKILAGAEDIGVKQLWLGDKLSNVRSYSREYLKKGAAVWNDFNEKDPKKQEWYYRTVAKHTEALKSTAAFREYVNLLNLVFGNV